MRATIIRYNGVRDIDVRFKDGTIAKCKMYGKFKRGNIAHPSTTAKARLGEIAHESLSQKCGSKDFHGFICRQGFKDEDRTLYECICKHCGLEDVLTPQEMMEHEKLEHRENK